MYLISTCKKHHTVVHLVAQDGEHSLCTYVPNEKTWPRAGGEIVGGKWVLSEDTQGRDVCLACRRRQKKESDPKVETRKVDKRTTKLAEQWRRFTGTELVVAVADGKDAEK